jgi:hypothetical protein
MTEKLIPGAASILITKQLDDAIKRTKGVFQRVQIMYSTIARFQKT